MSQTIVPTSTNASRPRPPMPPGVGTHCLSFSCARLKNSSNSGGGAPGFCPQGPGPLGFQEPPFPLSLLHGIGLSFAKNCPQSRASSLQASNGSAVHIKEHRFTYNDKQPRRSKSTNAKVASSLAV